MGLAGIQYKFAPAGELREVIIDATSDSEFVETLLDLIYIEEAKNDPVKPFDEVVARLDQKHRIKR